MREKIVFNQRVRLMPLAQNKDSKGWALRIKVAK